VEKPSATPWIVKKRDGKEARFQRAVVPRSIGLAAKGHGSDEDVWTFADRLAVEVEDDLRGQAIVTSQQVAAEVLKLLLRERGALADLRYASAVKPYGSVEDFWLEAFALDPDTTSG
jgi:transcriptional regulator NrdR family protein